MRYTIGGHPISHVTSKELCQQLLEHKERVENSKGKELPKNIFTANAQGLSYYAYDKSFAKDMDKADIVAADGQSLVLISKLLPIPDLPERLATTDFFHDVARSAQKNGLTFYFLGGEEDDNRDLVDVVKKLYPKLKIAGRHHGFFSNEYIPNVLQDINKTKTDVLWVGLGRPLQERFCVEYQKELRGVTWLIPCGGLYGYIIEKEPRAPLWMQKSGLEWFYRLLNDPRRLFKRYFFTNIHAVYLVLRHFKGR